MRDYSPCDPNGVDEIAPVITELADKRRGHSCEQGESRQLTPGGSVRALIAITRQAGYVSNPMLYQPASLPAGVTVSYDNSGIESAATGNVVAAIISASATALATTMFDIWVASWDHLSTASIGLSIYVTVNGAAVTTPPPVAPAPLSVSTSVFYTNVNPSTQTPTEAALTIGRGGG